MDVAHWSAIAGTGSAIGGIGSMLAAWSIYRFHLTNLRESVRPVLTPITFHRYGDDPNRFDKLVIGTIRNDGRGPAQFITVRGNSFGSPGLELATEAKAAHCISIAAGGKDVVDFHIGFLWEIVNAQAPRNELRVIQFSIFFDFADCQGNFYTTEYQLIAINPATSESEVTGMRVTDGIKLTNEITTFTTPRQRHIPRPQHQLASSRRRAVQRVRTT